MMDNNTFSKYKDLIYKKSGISLKEGKESLLFSRISKRLKELNLANMEMYYKYLCNDNTGDEMVLFLNAISTNVTHFFREYDHFDFMESILTSLFKEGKKKYRIWSCACSSGEEPYSIAISSSSIFNTMQLDFKILATDLSTKVLDIAKLGEYSIKCLDNFPEKYKKTNFYQLSSSNKLNYEKFYISQNIKKLISFCRLNLSESPFPMKGPFDFIFCRNVMIYFDNLVRQKLISELYRLLNNGGYLFVGHAESLAGINSKFKIIKPSIYQKVE